ncbi:MAG: hypothetical protein NT049_02010 [Planctomycetota bacterium]|nr:hypothetical protein [Planctomycetota bacterium]
MRTMALVMIVMAGLAAGGCSMWTPNRASGPAAGPSAADPLAGRESGAYLQKSSVARDSETPLPTAIESTLVLQDKYAHALEDLRREQDRSRELTDQKQQLADEHTRLQADLAKAQAELSDANNLLVQMRQEIDKWKGDVMGFREELRESNRAQIDALTKVMTLLGGETGPKAETPAPAAKPAPAAALAPAPATKPAAVAALSPTTGAPAGRPAAAGAAVKPLSASGTAAMAPATTGGGKEPARATNR